MSIIREQWRKRLVISYRSVINLITFTFQSAILDYQVSSPINRRITAFTYECTNFSYTRKAIYFVEQSVSLYQDAAGRDARPSARLGLDAADCCNNRVRVEQSTCLFVRRHQVWADAHPVLGFTSSQSIEFHGWAVGHAWDHLSDPTAINDTRHWYDAMTKATKKSHHITS